MKNNTPTRFTENYLHEYGNLVWIYWHG